MSHVVSLFDQQYGVNKWKFYDSIIKRLRCGPKNENTDTFPDLGLGNTPIFACKFAPQCNRDNLLAMANEDGQLAIMDTTDPHKRHCTRAHNNAIFDLAWMFNNMKIATASGDHSVRIFDVSTSHIQEVCAFLGHSRSVKTVTFRPDDPSIFASGGRDGNIILWDARSGNSNCIGRADKIIFNSHLVSMTPSRTRKKRIDNGPNSPGMSLNNKSVTGLVFQDDNTLISCGAGDGIIKVWDVRRTYTNYKQEPVTKREIRYGGSTTRNGFSSLIIDKDRLKLYASSLDHNIYSYNLHSYDSVPIMKYTGHQNSTFYVKTSISRDGLYLISGSSDDNAYIWNTNISRPLVKLTGHRAEVTCVAWCEQNCVDCTVVTCSDDMSHKIWRFEAENYQECDSIDQGRAEIVPLNTIISKLKRSAERNRFSPKKISLACANCDAPSMDKFCQNCTASSKRKNAEIATSDSKRQCLSPRRLFADLMQNADSCAAPTLNLPNFVMDGVAPHLSYSPPKRKEHDWLTKLRLEKKLLKRHVDSLAETAPPSKAPKLEQSTRKGAAQSPILKFVKVKSDGHCSAKALNTGSHVMASSPKTTQ